MIKLSQVTKFTYLDVYNYINNNNCKLITKIYINSKQKLEIQCLCGEIFFTTFDAFKFKKSIRCKKCSNKLISNSKKINYEYVKNYIESKDCVLLSKTINNAIEKLEIKCSCGEIFHRSFNKFKSSNQIKCLKCQNITNWNFTIIKEFVKNESNCEIISDEYVNRNEKLKFKCGCGLEFSTTFHSFLYSNKRQCDECGYKITANKNKKGIVYLKQYVLENSNCILISEDYKDYYDKLEFKCGCGNIFKTCFLSFMNGKKQCNLCSPNSTMEDIVKRILIDNNIKHDGQYSFENLRGVNGGLLRFDFVVQNENNNILFLLELDGPQHLKPFGYIGGIEKFKNTQIHDNLKNEYCRINNLNLIRIPFYEKDNIEKIMNDLIYKKC